MRCNRKERRRRERIRGEVRRTVRVEEGGKGKKNTWEWRRCRRKGEEGMGELGWGGEQRGARERLRKEGKIEVETREKKV